MLQVELENEYLIWWKLKSTLNHQFGIEVSGLVGQNQLHRYLAKTHLSEKKLDIWTDSDTYDK